MKRLKNIEDNSKITKENKDTQLGIKSIGYADTEKLSQEAKNLLEKLNNQEKLINYKKLNFKRGNNLDHDFSDYSSLKELFRPIYFRKLTIEEAERIQDEFNNILGVLEDYPAKAPKYKEHKKNLLINAKSFYDEREMIANAFKNGIFPLVPSVYTSDDDRSLRPDSPASSFNTTDKPDKSNEFDFTVDDLDKIYIGDADDLDVLLLDTEKYLDPDLTQKYFLTSFKKKYLNF